MSDSHQPFGEDSSGQRTPASKIELKWSLSTFRDWFTADVTIGKFHVPQWIVTIGVLIASAVVITIIPTALSAITSIGVERVFSSPTLEPSTQIDVIYGEAFSLTLIVPAYANFSGVALVTDTIGIDARYPAQDFAELRSAPVIVEKTCLVYQTSDDPDAPPALPRECRNTAVIRSIVQSAFWHDAQAQQAVPFRFKRGETVLDKVCDLSTPTAPVQGRCSMIWK